MNRKSFISTVKRSFSASTSTLTSSPSSVLPFGQYLENRKGFLATLERTTRKRLVDTSSRGGGGGVACGGTAILESTGSISNETALITHTGGIFDDEPPYTSRMGSSVRDTFHIRQMLACGMHLGHAPRKWHPKMRPYLWGERGGIHIMDLAKTLACLRVAASVTADIAGRGGVVVFVGTRDPIQRLVYQVATDAGQYYVNRRWIGGTLTNRRQVLRAPDLLPDLLVVLDYPNNLHALVEAERAAIPTVAICDSDCDPTRVTYPIPANDDALSSVELVARTLGLAARRGRESSHHGNASSQIILEQAGDFLQKMNAH